MLVSSAPHTRYVFGATIPGHVVLQCVALCCSVLQRIAVWEVRYRCHDPSGCFGATVAVWCSVLQCVAVCCCVRGTSSVPPSLDTLCCSVLQSVAACCSGLQCARYVFSATIPRDVVLQCVAVCCSVLQCVAVCCNVLQCESYVLGATIPRDVVLRCVAVCCSVLQCGRYLFGARIPGDVVLQCVAVCHSVLHVII